MRERGWKDGENLPWTEGQVAVGLVSEVRDIVRGESISLSVAVVWVTAGVVTKELVVTVVVALGTFSSFSDSCVGC